MFLPAFPFCLKFLLFLQLLRSPSFPKTLAFCSFVSFNVARSFQHCVLPCACHYLDKTQNLSQQQDKNILHVTNIIFLDTVPITTYPENSPTAFTYKLSANANVFHKIKSITLLCVTLHACTHMNVHPHSDSQISYTPQ